jgi:cytochrome c biogenesis protein CcmG/thiol:disulfide interchange protein DsbE
MERNDETSVNRGTELSRWTEDRLAALRPDGEWDPNVARGLALLRERQRVEHRGAKRYAWLTAAVVATCVPLMAMPATRALAQRCVSACVNQSGWVRDLLTGNMPGPSTVFISREDREMAPDFTLNDASGDPVTLSALRGKVVLLNFWATWCVPCKVEIPWFIELQKSRKSAGLEVLGISLDDDGWKSVKPFVEARDVNYRVVIGNQDIAGLYGGVTSLPATLIIDRSGRIAAVHVGLCSKSEYEGDVRAVLNEQ